MKIVSHATPGFVCLPHDAQIAAHREFERQAKEKDDWMYEIAAERIPGGLPDGSLFVFFAQNETGGYTAMLGSEY